MAVTAPPPSYRNASTPTSGTGAPTNAPATQPTIYSPSSASSGFYTTDIENLPEQVTVGPELAQMLGIPPGPYSTKDLIHDFEVMGQSQRGQLQALLAAGGFYTTSQGAPSTTPFTGGVADEQTFNAFANAVLAAAQSAQTNPDGSPVSIDDMINNRAALGTGAQQQTQGNAIVGGNNAYQIKLTDPTDIAYTAHTVFQAALGRDPTTAELARITATLQGRQTAAGQAEVAQGEQVAKTKYQADVGAYQAGQAPREAGGIPNGPMQDTSQWAVAFLHYMNDPVTQSNVSTILGLISSLGGNLAGNNPLAITLPETGSAQTGPGPNQTPQDYTSVAQGMYAAKQTLASGAFPGLMEALSKGDASSTLGNKDIQGEIHKFTNGKTSDITKAAASQTQAAATAVGKYAQPLPQLATGGEGVSGAQAPPVGAQATPDPNNPQPAFGTSAADFRQAEQASEAPGTGSAADFRQAEEASQAPPVSSQTITPDQLGTQQPLPQGSGYLPPNVLNQVTPPDQNAVEFQAATTGANQIPYEGYIYLQAFNAIMSMVNANKATGM